MRRPPLCLRVLRRERLTARIGAAAISLLACLIGLSAAVRLAVGWLRTTPSYFADEYLYAEMARSFLETGRPTIREADAVFPSLLQPIILPRPGLRATSGSRTG